MNKFFTLVLLCFTVLLTSCQFSENIYFNEDGSGKMSFGFDASQLMEMAGDEMMKEGEKAIDSTVHFKDFLIEKKDSIAQLSAEEQAKLKQLEPFSMHMVMEPKEKKMLFDLYTNFKSVDEIQDMFKAMNNVSNMSGQGGTKANDANNPFSTFAENGATEVSYSMKGNKFKRLTKVKDKEAYQVFLDSMSQMSMMFDSSKYTLNYHFTKKVKSVSNENATLGEDGKSVTLELNFMDYMNDPEILNLEVVLED